MEAISFDLKAESACFKKNDFNDNQTYQTYNFIHKPCVLGILGAILGLKGYHNLEGESLPEYYKKLQDLKIGIKLNNINLPKKTEVHFNETCGGGQGGANLQVREEVLIGEPEINYTIFIINENNPLFEQLKNKIENEEATFPIYLGKNEHFAYFENYNEYSCKEAVESEVIISTIFPQKNIANYLTKDESIVYERLPISLNEDCFYIKDLFIKTANKIKLNILSSFYQVKNTNTMFYIYGI